MIFLLQEFWPFLTAALLLGSLGGWAAEREDRLRNNDCINYLICLAFLLAMCAAAIGLAPGKMGLWIDVFILHFAFYATGWTAACLMGSVKPQAALRPARVTAKPEDTSSVSKKTIFPAAKTDNLKKIRGIGKVFEAKLNALGVNNIRQIAAWSEKEADEISIKLGFPGRARRGGWVEQAKALIKSQD